MIYAYMALAISIAFELIGTTFLKSSEGFTKIPQTIGVIVSYTIAFYVLTKVLNYLPLSITYATWSGVGLIAATCISIFIFNESANIFTITGIALIVVGVVILNLLGNVGH